MAIPLIGSPIGNHVAVASIVNRPTVSELLSGEIDPRERAKTLII